MSQDPLMLAIIGALCLAFLLLGYWIGARLSTSKAAQLTAELQSQAQSDQQQLQSDLALANQRESQLLRENTAEQQQQQQLSKILADMRLIETAQAAQVSALQEKLTAEQARTQDKTTQLQAQVQQTNELAAQLQQLRDELTELRQQLGQSQEQAKQLVEQKEANTTLQSRFEQAQEQLKTQREQLGQNTEQTNHLVELKQSSNQLQEKLDAAQEQLKAQREQLGQSAEQAVQLQEIKDTNAELNQRLEKANEEFKKQREQLGQASEQKHNLDESRTKLLAQEGELIALRQSLSAAQASIAELNTGREKDQQSAAEKLQLLQDNKEQLKHEFQNLANQIFDTKQQSFSEQSRQGLDTLLKPFKDQLESFRQRVDKVHSETIDGQSSMKSELGKLMELNSLITTEASNLTKALKGDKKLQGTWGEQKVELLLEQAGLRKGFEYNREANFKDENADNARPDFVIKLPEGKHIIVDSKVSLVAYTDYVAAETDEQRAIALATHIQALKNHITGLAGKKYPELTDINSPDFVFLFMPIEPAYLVAAEHSPALFQAAYEQRIAIVTATTLLPVLRVVSNLWSIQRQNQSTQQLAEQASKVYDKLRVFVVKMEKLGHQITTLQNTYDDSFKTLSGNHGGLTKTVDKFVELGVKVVKRLPASVSSNDNEQVADIDLLLEMETAE